MKTQNNAMQKLALTAMFAALTAVATMVIRIPAPVGYVNLGDAIVLLAGMILGPAWGFLAGSVGSALADLMAGYGMYVPATFVIKGLAALIAALLLGLFYQRNKAPSLPRLLACTVPAEAVMVLGYFAYEMAILKLGLGAAEAVPFNAAQGLVGVIAAVVLFRLLHRVPALRQRFWKG